MAICPFSSNLCQTWNRLRQSACNEHEDIFMDIDTQCGVRTILWSTMYSISQLLLGLKLKILKNRVENFNAKV